MNSSDPNNHYYLSRYFGQIYESYDVSLLIGSKEEKEANNDLIERLKNEFEFEEIKLISYEELLDDHVKLCNRLMSFSVF